MARSIDGGLEPTAHSAVQAMIVRAQQLADQSGKSVGLVYDLTKDEISLVDIADSDAAGVDFVRIMTPAEDGQNRLAESAGDPFQQEFCFEL